MFSQSFADMCRTAKKFKSQCAQSQLRLNKTMPSCFSSHTVNKCPFQGLFSAMSFAFLCFLLVISLLKTPPKYSADVLSGVPKFKKAVMCFTKKSMH